MRKIPLPAESGEWQKIAGDKIISDAIKVAEDSVENGVRTQFNPEVCFAATVSTLLELPNEAQMVVVGCRGHGTLRRIALGSVGAGLIHHADRPVAIIHDEAP